MTIYGWPFPDHFMTISRSLVAPSSWGKADALLPRCNASFSFPWPFMRTHRSFSPYPDDNLSSEVNVKICRGRKAVHRSEKTFFKKKCIVIVVDFIVAVIIVLIFHMPLPLSIRYVLGTTSPKEHSSAEDECRRHRGAGCLPTEKRSREPWARDGWTGAHWVWGTSREQLPVTEPRGPPRLIYSSP